MNLPVQPNFDRRDMLRGGALLGLASLLAGCATNRSAGMPGPVWPDQGIAKGSPSGKAASVPSNPAPAARATQADYYRAPSNVIARSQWTNQGLIKSRLTANGQDGKMGQINRITVHHDALESGSIRTQSDAIRRVNTIRNGHISRKPEPFADIGYHFVIDPQGRIWEARSLYYQGAHVKGQNENNVGIVVMGNFDYQRPNAAAIKSLDAFVAQLMHKYNIPVSRVKTHQEMAATECPGRNLQRYMVSSRSRGGAIARA